MRKYQSQNIKSQPQRKHLHKQQQHHIFLESQINNCSKISQTWAKFSRSHLWTEPLRLMDAKLSQTGISAGSLRRIFATFALRSESASRRSAQNLEEMRFRSWGIFSFAKNSDIEPKQTASNS